jgi:hypothetical protein
VGVDLLEQVEGVQGPLRTNTAGTAGSATISGTAITSGQFKNTSNVVVSVTTCTSGPVTVHLINQVMVLVELILEIVVEITVK